MGSRSSPQKIEGRHHPLLKEVRRAVRSGELLSDGMVLLETVRLVEDALRSGFKIPKVYTSRGAGKRARDLMKNLPPETVVYEVAQDVFESLGSTQTSQGVMALASAPNWREEDLFARESPLILVLAGVQDPGNLGSLIRTSEAFGVTGMILTGGTVSPYNAKVVRAAAGALLRTPILRDLAATEVIAILGRRRIQLFSGVVEGGKRLPGINFTGPTAVALGSEGAGLPAELAASGQRFTIPVPASVESLNVAAAGAVILYEIARQRNFKGTERSG